MQLIQSPTLPPGCCFICRASQRESYIDTGVSHDYEGAYYICNMCLGEMARMHSFLSHDEYKDLRQSKEELEHQNFELIKRLGEFDELRDAMARAGYKLSDDGDVVVRGGYSPQANAYPDEREQGAKASVGIGEGEITESLHDAGMDELYSDELPTASEFSLDL